MKKPEPLPIIKNRHYAQSSLAAKRRKQRIERVRRGEAKMPERRRKKGQGVYARLHSYTWSPFDEDGTLKPAYDAGFVHAGALVEPTYDEAKKLDIVSWMDEQADRVTKNTLVFDENGDEVAS